MTLLSQTRTKIRCEFFMDRPWSGPGGHTLVAQHLLEARGDVNQGKHDQTTPLYIASQNNHTDTFRLLLHERADPNVQNANGATPLFISSQNLWHDVMFA